jgi:hypothetical protein
MRIFVAGATGVLSRRIVPWLVIAGHQVTAVTRSAGKVSALRDAGATPVVADVFAGEALWRAVAQAAPDLVMHQLTDLAGGNTEANTRTWRVSPRWRPRCGNCPSGWCCVTDCSTVPAPGTRPTGGTPSRHERDGWARGAGNRHARHDLGWKPRYPSWRNGFGEPTD